MPVRVDVAIEAAPEAVWAVVADVERWPEWTPTMTRVELLDGDTLALGSRARVKQPRLPVSELRVTEFVAGQNFVWETSAFGATTAAGHAVRPEGDGAVVTLSVETRGRMAWLVRPLVEWFARRYVPQEAAGLKRRCEGGEDGGA